MEGLLDQLTNPPKRKVVRPADIHLLPKLTNVVDRTESTASRLVVLCRDLEQVVAACQCQVDLVYADFADIRQYADAVKIANEHATPIGLASVRMQKPGEMGLLKVLTRHRPDFLLARNLAAIDYGRKEDLIGQR